MSRADDISGAAAGWLTRLEGQTSPQVWEAFEAWTEEDPRHRAAFIRLRVAWNHADRLKNMRPADGTIDRDLLGRSRISPATLAARGLRPSEGAPRKRLDELIMPDRRRVLATMTAIAVAGVCAWFGAYQLGWNTYETGVGGRQKVALSDGSTVDLNTNTQLNAKLSGSRRDIRLNRGEALFHVAHDSTRPFYVTAGETVVRAVGTSFSVRIRDSEHVEVLVAEGRVVVGAPGTDANFENTSLLATAPKVGAGETASVRRNSVAMHSLPQRDVTRKLAWTEGHLAFKGETIEDAVREFNRYNRRQIAIADPTILTLQVGGTFLATDPDSFIAALQRSFDIQAEVGSDDGNIRLSGPKPP